MATTTEMRQSILIVEDERNVAEVVERYLVKSGFRTLSAADGLRAMELVEKEGPDLVVLDVMLPGLDGLSIARRMREAGNNTPVIMLTARGQESDIVAGLTLGADDYMAKPFSPTELLARINAVLRRTSGIAPATGPLIKVGDLRISGAERSVTRCGEPVTLTQKEFDLLHFLASNSGKVFGREELLERVWGYAIPGDTSTVTVHIRRLRSKLEENPEQPRYISTVWGVGYRFDRP